MTAAAQDDLMSALVQSSIGEWGEADRDEDEAPAPSRGTYRQVLIKSLIVDPEKNSRSTPAHQQQINELAENINENGLLNPITVTSRGLEYELVAGYRRVAACRKLGWVWIDASITEASEENARLLNLSENLARKDLRLYDTMRTLSYLKEQGVPIRKLQTQTGIGAHRVETMLRVWPRLSPFIKDKWRDIPEPTWEPSLTQLEAWSELSRGEQDRAWKEWCFDDDETLEDDFGGLDFDPKRKGRPRASRRKVSEIKKAIDTLPMTEIGEAKRSALLWALGRRERL
jgi:ParB/RepB/Spo0J family partition protein